MKITVEIQVFGGAQEAREHHRQIRVAVVRAMESLIRDSAESNCVPIEGREHVLAGSLDCRAIYAGD